MKPLLNNTPDHRHYPRLIKKNNIAAVEIHSKLLISKYDNEFNYGFVAKDIQIIDAYSVLSHDNKLNFSILSKQINDSGFHYKTIPLRSMYIGKNIWKSGYFHGYMKNIRYLDGTAV